MRILYLIGIILLFSTLVSSVFAQSNLQSELQNGELNVPTHFYAAAAVPQVYTYVLRPINGQTQNVVNFQSDTSSFSSVTTNAPYKVGVVTLSHYKLSREPISKFSLAKRTFEYVTLESNTTILARDGVTAKLSFSVDKSWISNAGGVADQIALYVFDDTWKKLDTRLITTTGNKYDYEAYSSTFGYFAIALDRPLTTQSATTTTAQGASGSTSNSNSDSSSATSKTDAANANAPQLVDTKTTQPVEVVYPLLDSQEVSGSSGLLQKIIGFGLLIFALTGVAIVSVTVIQSRRQMPAQFKTTGSVNELLTKLQSSRAQPPKSTMPRYSSDVNALLAKVNARYQPAVSASMPKMQASFMANSSSFASTLSHSLDDLKSKVAELEPDIVKRYTDWGMSHGHSLDMIKRDLVEHEIDEELINRVLHNTSKKY